MAVGPGPVALVGSGEFLGAMEPVDAGLLEGRPPRAVIIPTAAAREGDARVQYWIDLGRRHYEAIGVEPVPLDVRSRADADDPAVAERVAGAGLVYLSGGDPHHLADTLRASSLWEAVTAAWRAGAALAGCSAGAMALSAGAPPDLLARRRSTGHPPERDGPARSANGLGLLPGLAVIPHFDQITRWRRGALEWFAAWQPPGTTLVGIEEETALVGDGAAWVVQGTGTVWVFDGDARRELGAGDTVTLDASAGA